MASDWRDIGGFPCRRSEWWSSPKEAATGGSVHATIASPVIASKGGRVATLLTDLLTPDEAEDRRKIFDIDLLADRVLMAKAWLEQGDRTEGLGIGYFGASTEVGAALRRLPAIPRRSKPSCRVEEDRIWRSLSAVGHSANDADCRWRRRAGNRDESCNLPVSRLP